MWLIWVDRQLSVVSCHAFIIYCTSECCSPDSAIYTWWPCLPGCRHASLECPAVIRHDHSIIDVVSPWTQVYSVQHFFLWQWHVALFNYVQCPRNYCDGVTLDQCLINNNNIRGPLYLSVFKRLAVLIDDLWAGLYCKSYQLISLKLGLMVGPSNRKNWLTFGGDLIPNTDSGSFFHVPHHRGIGFSYSHRPIFATLATVTYADKIMNPQHFGSEPVDNQFRSQIKPEIRIRIPDHFWLRFLPWRRFALSEHSVVVVQPVKMKP